MRLILGIILSVVLVSSFMSVYATVQEDIEKLEKDIEKQQKKIDTFQLIIDRFQSLIDLAQSRIDEKLTLINELKNENDDGIYSIKIKDNTLEKFPYDLEEELIGGTCKASILGFVEAYVGENRSRYEPKLYFENIGTDVAYCKINPLDKDETRIISIRAETDNGLDLQLILKLSNTS